MQSCLAREIASIMVSTMSGTTHTFETKSQSHDGSVYILYDSSFQELYYIIYPRIILSLIQTEQNRQTHANSLVVNFSFVYSLYKLLNGNYIDSFI